MTPSPFQNGGPQVRDSSPRPGRSTFTTSAPSEPRRAVQYGPATELVRSTTRVPESGRKATDGARLTIYLHITEKPATFSVIASRGLTTPREERSMSRIRGYLAVAVASSALTALGGAAGIGASTSATAPQNTSRPTISGTPAAGQTLTASPGSWSGTTPISYAYQWGRCKSSGACRTIRGANGTSYKVTSDDIGHALRVRVTAQNSAGKNSADSDPTGTVAANPDTPANTAK